MSLPGLDRDPVKVYRPGAGADAEGVPTAVLTLVYDGVGTWGTPGAVDRQIAAQRGQQLDAVVAMTFRPNPGDVADVRGFRWVVVAVTDTRFHYRAFLRRAE